MRSLLLILATSAALLCAFALYVRLESPPFRPGDAGVSDTTVPPAGSANQPYAAGAWSNLYDKDGQLYGRLRSRTCVPQPDGTWQLSDPEADFYQRDGQIAHMTALNGQVRLGQQTHNETLGNGPVDPPSQGLLRDVTVRLYADEAARHSDEPEMTLHLDNARFDADTYRLYTVADGATDADQIPITVRGRQIDFDGRGLLLEWNGQSHQLKSLVVTHEQRMELRPQSSAPTTRTTRHESATTKPAPVHVYLATFAGGVRVTQSGQERISSPQMTVTLATGAAPKPVESHPPATPRGEKSPSPQAPIDLFWGGTATIIPAANSTASSLSPGQAIIRFDGGDVRVRQDNMSLLGDDVRYDTATESATALGSPNRLLQMSFLNRDGKPSGTVVTEQAQYWQRDQRVALIGAGAGEFTDPNKPTDVMNAAWSEACNLKLGGTGGHLDIQHAQLLGDAIVRDGPANGPPKLRLTAQRIDTDFAQATLPPAAQKSRPGKTPPTESVLRRMVATTDAHCTIHDAKESDRAISSDTLTMEMAEDAAGKTYPHFVTADGNVHAQQDQQDLWTRKLDATVMPVAGKTKADESRFQVQTMIADGDVRLRGKNGQRAAGDTLTIEEHDGQPWISLVGNPMATVTGDNRTLSGHELQLRPHENWAAVTGPGTIEGLAASKAGKPPQPIHARWTTSAAIFGDENRIEILGGVVADTTESTGVTNRAAADRTILTLAARPTTRPSRATTQEFNPLKDKQIQLISLLQHASLESTLLGPGGAIVRRSFIEGDRLDSDVPAQRLVVPGPGRMLLEEHRPRNNADKSPVSGQGITAFAWNKEFTYDQTARQAVIEGSVYIKHEPDTAKSAPTSLAADRVIADFEPPPAGSADAEPRLKQFRGIGHILIQSGTRLIQASSVVYDPTTELLTISGTPTEPMTITDSKTNGQENCDQATVNIRTNEFKAINVSGNGRK